MEAIVVLVGTNENCFYELFFFRGAEVHVRALDESVPGEGRTQRRLALGTAQARTRPLTYLFMLSRKVFTII
jgi:hypothetical protein